MQTLLSPRWRSLFRWPVASLRTYLIVVIVVATVPLGALTSWLMAQEILASRQQLSSGLKRAASSVALTIEREQMSSIDALAILSYADALQAQDLAGFHRMLVQLPRIRPTWRRVFLMDLQGHVLLSNDRPFGQSIKATIPGAEWRQAVKDVRPVITGLVVPESAQGWTTRIDVPVLINGRLRYILAAQIDPSTWQNLIAGSSAPPQGHVTLFDAGHRVVARSVHADRFRGRLLPAAGQRHMAGKASGFHKSELLEGGSTYVAWQRVGLSGWGVGVGVKAEPLDQANLHAISVATGAGLLSLLAGVGLSLVVARRVNGPLAALARGGPGAAQGNIAVREITWLRDALWAAEQQREQVRERLQAKAAEFETLFNTSPIGLSITQDPDCREVLRNPAKIAMFDIKPGEAPRYRLIQNGQVLTPDRHPLQRAARGETVWNQELEVHHPDGRLLKLLAHAVPLLDAQGRPRGAIGTLVDITERMQAQERLVQAERRLRESQHLVELAQEAGGVGFFDHGIERDTVTLTSGLARLLGLAHQEFTTSWAGWLKLVNPDDAAQVDTLVRQAWQQGLEEVTFQLRTLNGREAVRWLSGRMVVMYDEDRRPSRMIGVMVDVTAQQLVEQERARLIAQEQKARIEAENANRAKDEFLAMLGHELRNPLGAISAAVEVLNRTSVQDDASVRVRQIITRQTKHLARMMDDLLDVARVITGKIMLARQPVNLGACVERLVNTLTMSGVIHQHPITLALDEVWINADAMRLEQIINNLITNAVKYSPAGRPITVRVERQGGMARLQVEDQGMGIPDTLLPRIFDIFVQGERTLDRRQGGLGIGLTLVKRLVELHDGQVSVSSSSAGSVFTVDIPCIHAPPQESPSTTSRGQHPLRLVVVEDNEDTREALRFLLEIKGHQVWFEEDGDAGLARILASRPDAALVDISLPGLTGFEVARRARAAGYQGRLIALSGHGQHSEVQRAQAFGFEGHLPKPIERSALDQVLGDLARHLEVDVAPDVAQRVANAP